MSIVLRERGVVIKEAEDDNNDKIYTVTKIRKKMGSLLKELYFTKFEPYNAKRLPTTLIKACDIL